MFPNRPCIPEPDGQGVLSGENMKKILLCLGLLAIAQPQLASAQYWGGNGDATVEPTRQSTAASLAFTVGGLIVSAGAGTGVGIYFSAVAVGAAPVSATVAGVAAGVVTAAGGVVVGFYIYEPEKFSASSQGKKAMLVSIQEDAAAYMASDGAVTTVLLRSIFSGAREQLREQRPDLSITDESLAQGLLAAK